MTFGRDVLPPFSCLNALDLAGTVVIGRKKSFGYAGVFADPCKPTYLIFLKMEAHFHPNG